MKRKVGNPDIQKKKHIQAIEKVQDQDMKQELESKVEPLPKKSGKSRPKTGHK